MTAPFTDRFQGTATSVAIKAPVRVVANSAITTSGLQTIDGVALAEGDRVLRNAPSGSTRVLNGIWIAQETDWYRALDFNGDRDIAKGTQVYVTDGDTGAGATYALTTDAPIIGTSNLSFGILFTSVAGRSFADWAEAMTATVPAYVMFIWVGGLGYTRWTGTVIPGAQTADGAKWAPHLWDIHKEHFLTDGLSEQEAMENALAWCAEVGALDPFLETPDRDFPTPLTIHCDGAFWSLTEEVIIPTANASITIRGGAFKAIGNSWTDADPYADWTWSAATVAGGNPIEMTAEEVEDATRIARYRPRRSDYMFRAQGGASRVRFDGTRLNCNQKCGGLRLAAGSIADKVEIRNCAGVGFENVGGAVQLIDCSCSQWTINADVEYYDAEAYTGIAIFTEDTDLRVTGGRFQWMYELVRFEATNNITWLGYYGNGSAGYNAVDRHNADDEPNLSEEFRQAIFDYFSVKAEGAAWTTPEDVDTHDFTPRDFNIGFTTAAFRDKATYEADPAAGPLGKFKASRMDVKFNMPYWDNCVHRFYTNGWVIDHPSIGSKKTSSLSPTVEALVYCYAFNETVTPRCAMIKAQIFVESTNNSEVDEVVEKHMMRFVDGPYGGDWVGDFSTFNDDEEYNWCQTVSAGNAFLWSGFTLTTDYHLHGGADNPSKYMVDAGTGSFIAYLDINTTDPVMVGVSGDTVIHKPQTGTNAFRIEAAKGIAQFRELAAIPAGIASYDVVMSDGTIDGALGAMGKGLYEVFGGAIQRVGKRPVVTVGQLAAITGMTAGDQAYVTNEAGGAVGAEYDGTNWRRITDRAIVS